MLLNEFKKSLQRLSRRVLYWKNRNKPIVIKQFDPNIITSNNEDYDIEHIEVSTVNYFLLSTKKKAALLNLENNNPLIKKQLSNTLHLDHNVEKYISVDFEEQTVSSENLVDGYSLSETSKSFDSLSQTCQDLNEENQIQGHTDSIITSDTCVTVITNGFELHKQNLEKLRSVKNIDILKKISISVHSENVPKPSEEIVGSQSIINFQNILNIHSDSSEIELRKENCSDTFPKHKNFTKILTNLSRDLPNEVVSEICSTGDQNNQTKIDKQFSDNFINNNVFNTVSNKEFDNTTLLHRYLLQNCVRITNATNFCCSNYRIESRFHRSRLIDLIAPKDITFDNKNECLKTILVNVIKKEFSHYKSINPIIKSFYRRQLAGKQQFHPSAILLRAIIDDKNYQTSLHLVLSKEGVKEFYSDSKINKIFILIVNAEQADEINSVLPDLMKRLSLFLDSHSTSNKDFTSEEIWKQIANIDWSYEQQKV